MLAETIMSRALAAASEVDGIASLSDKATLWRTIATASKEELQGSVFYITLRVIPPAVLNGKAGHSAAVCGPCDFRVKWRALTEKGERVDPQRTWAPVWTKAPWEEDPVSFLCLLLVLGIFFGTLVGEHTGLISRIWADFWFLRSLISLLCPDLN